MKTNIFNAIKVSTLAIVLSFGLSYVYAWTTPSGTPPTGNVSAPINTSGAAQIKTGNFTAWNIGANSVTVTGNATVNDVYITSIGKYASELYPVNLVNGQHTVTQCSSLGGTAVDDGTGKKMCKFAIASCPLGWAQYNNWSTTQGQSLIYYNETLTGSCTPSPPKNTSKCGVPSPATCSANSHPFGNIAKESSVTCVGAEKFDSVLTTDPWECSEAGCSGATTVTAVTTISEVGCY